MPDTTSFLYENSSKSVTVLDLPRSIEHGQGVSAELLSSLAPEAPHPSTEPKGRKREKLLNATPAAERESHLALCEILDSALREARSSIRDRDWCFPRHEQHPPLVELPQLALDRSEEQPRVTQPPLFLSRFENHVPDFAALRSALIVNPLPSSALLTAEAHSFRVPPQSVFLCSSIADGMCLMSNILKSNVLSTSANESERQFDFVLLDPPWANRSVRKAGSYKTTESQGDPFHDVLPILGSSIAPNGIVAIWITNKSVIRRSVLLALKSIHFELVGEWIWLKVTRRGEPVTELDGLWRKPYETLLFFSRAKSSTTSIQRRILIAVPDLHSRKPCLKDLIEPLLPRPYRALEIFSRYLTAGWWSWGDECLKYQHTSQWKS